MSVAQAVPEIYFFKQALLIPTMPRSVKGNNPVVKYLQNFTHKYSDHLLISSIQQTKVNGLLNTGQDRVMILW